MSRAARRGAGLIGLTLCVLPVAAQLSVGTALGSTTSNSSSSAVVSRTLRGHVVSSVTGAAIPRVLVQVGVRSVLTDSQGRFELPEYTDTQAYVTLTNPQYSQTYDLFQGLGRQRLTDLDAVAELKMYPDAIIAGTVTGRDGLPLTGIAVQLLHQIFNVQSGLIMQPIKFAQTNLSGEFRFRVPAGRFELSLSYSPHVKDTGEAILPLIYPDNTGSSRSVYFEAAPGEEKHIDLRPRTGPVYAFSVRVEGSDARRGVQFTALTPSGEPIPGGGSSISSPSAGVYQLSLPKGTYTLQARVEDRETEVTGSTRITVSGNQSEPGIIHLEPATSLPVEISVDPAGAAAAATASSGTAGVTNSNQTVPSAQQFNLALRSESSNRMNQRQPNLQQRPDKTFEFRVTPGRYKLAGNGGGAWYVESATYGVTDALTNDIVVSSGGSGAPIRLVVNNMYGSVTGTVQFANATDPVWVYLIPTTPTLAPVNPISIINTGAASTTFTSRAPAGTYLAVALDHRVTDDLHNPDVLSRFSSSGQPVTLSPSAAVTVNLVISIEKEAGK